MDLGLAGKSVQSTLIEYTLRLRLSDVHFIVIESPFTLHAAGHSISLSSEDDPDEAFEPVRQLVGQTVEDALAD